VSFADDLRASVLAAAENLVNAAAQECRRQTAEAAPTPMTGDLNKSIQVDVAQTDGTTIGTTIYATAEHASYTDEGTGVYVGRGRIYPRTARALVFYWITGPQGSGVYAFKSVAGQPGQHWFKLPMPTRWTASLQWAIDAGAFRSAP